METYRFTDTEGLLMEKSPVPFAVYQFIDRRVVVVALSEGFCRLFGYEDRETAYYDMNNNMYKDTHPDDAARIADAAMRFATEDSSYDVVYRTRKKDGSGYRVIHASGEHVYPGSGVRLAYVWYTDEGDYTAGDSSDASDLSSSLDRALSEESRSKARYYDFLTGLPSMTYFFDLAQATCKTMLREGKKPALLYIDMIGMKYYNHKYGFNEGDSLLREFAKTLIRYFTEKNCSRFGQDHFVVITEEDGLENTLSWLMADCRELKGGLSLPIRAGIYLYNMGAVGVTTACDRAKIACDSLRNTYVSDYHYFNESMQNNAELQQYIISNLDRAISEKWIKVYYQPIIRSINGKVCDEEALARWDDPVMGFLSPADFIPVLEESQLIYKMDLYMVEQVLEKLKMQEKAGLHLVPQSINLSRVDFEKCDIVEEICSRVDASGMGRDKITIEITESIIGRDFEFMKEQINRFKNLGFHVWMDDFGSGYSSLDVLQSIKFNLIKFDMRFMQQLDKGDNARIVFTEMMKMATALGLDTVCEGVETREQVQFLNEIGCSKQQGFYYCRPIPFEQVLKRYEDHVQIGFENPEEAEYYETVGRLNLHDLSDVTREDEGRLHGSFNMLPMAVMEIKDGSVDLVRSNPSYRDFLAKLRKLQEITMGSEFEPGKAFFSSVFYSALMQCCKDRKRVISDETFSDGTTVHSFVRWLNVNPVTGKTAIAVAILSMTKGDKGASYANIARALAADYFNLFYVDLNTEEFIEYTSNPGREEMAMERHGEDFFRRSRQDAKKYLYRDDQDSFIEAFTKENVLAAIDSQGAFTYTYRLMNDGEPVYANMKAMRMRYVNDHIIIGVSNIDSQMRDNEIRKT